MIWFGIIGLISISVGLWFKKEIKQDLVFIIGGISLLVYSFYIKDYIFLILQIVFILSALIELIKLSLKNGRH